ncbi:5-oxoprolinase subunit PxpB [Amycolatopsis anabasis]|uniref:5-oxoprolinase subunit PxpB n=1 Tax=Amycolatopsis anabasis TaxID=1840409 RepID=UPI00131D4EC6|nr:5-oxoprolinase subunit PxpB [Amycolatopsis anabasis]
MRVRRYGSRAALVDLDRPEQVLGLHAALAERPPAGAVELVPAARTLLVRFDRRQTSFERLTGELMRHSIAAAPERARPVVEVPVRYDGEDLADVAAATGLSTSDIAERHAGREYTVAFCGFAPGFAYLTGLDPVLHLPRRATPRVRVPAGAVAVAGEYTAVYPHASPGGWQLIGHTELAVWDVDRDPPHLLGPGTRVRFVPR